MCRRGLASPDDGDALALTFAYPVAKRDWAEERRYGRPSRYAGKSLRMVSDHRRLPETLSTVGSFRSRCQEA
jgi:hypothetical protein